MNDASAKIKQQIIDKIKSTTNILVTVSRNPSVDDLSAMIGMTALLNKMGKHATAIFSGLIPPAIAFLEPDKIIENSADSLRDFIIALDKEKADHLRYKVDGDVVKIFITPYRANISANDLEFSQGDYNVELVLALGVTNQAHLDEALTAHGSVFENVTVATFAAGQILSQLGNLIWNDQNASSLSEMVFSVGESFKSDKPMLDKQIATALLTGIVAATDRFSNPRTTPEVMNVAAQLMAAGADQQLIAAKLRETHEINDLTPNPADVVTVAPTPESEMPVELANAEPNIVQSTLPSDGNFTIQHDGELPSPTEIISTLPEPVAEPEPEIAPELTPEAALDAIISNNTNVEIPNIPVEPYPQPVASELPTETPEEPLLGGTLSATSDQAAEDARRELESEQNKTILTHSYIDEVPANTTPINGAGQSEDSEDATNVFNRPYSLDEVDSPEPVAPTSLYVEPPKFDMPLPPPLPDFSTMATPSIPNFDAVPMAPTPAVMAFGSGPEPIEDDPTQFRIPGQPL